MWTSKGMWRAGIHTTQQLQRFCLCRYATTTTTKEVGAAPSLHTCVAPSLLAAKHSTMQGQQRPSDWQLSCTVAVPATLQVLCQQHVCTSRLRSPNNHRAGPLLRWPPPSLPSLQAVHASPCRRCCHHCHRCRPRCCRRCRHLLTQQPPLLLPLPLLPALPLHHACAGCGLQKHSQNNSRQAAEKEQNEQMWQHSL